MQTLWSRAAQAQSACRCRLCLHSTNAVARRSTTAASRRRVTAADLFTACYTTILGTAVVVDTRQKEVRRKELDAKLDKARASLSALAIQQAPSGLDDTNSDLPQDGANERGGYESNRRTSGTKSTASLMDELEQMAGAALRPGAHQPWPRYRVDWVQVEAAIATEEKALYFPMRHPKDPDQMKRTTATMEALVQSLIWRVRADHSGQTSSGDRVLSEAEDLLRTYPMYENPNADPASSSSGRNLLSRTFRQILDGPADIKEAVGKICCNILISESAPNIHNYNTLIAGFNRIQRPDLAEVVVKSYLEDTTWPATRQTICCLLQHTADAGDHRFFRHIVRRMRGAGEDGLHYRLLSKPAIFTPSRAEWARARATPRKHTYVQRAYRDDPVFNTLIRSWLQLGKLTHASAAFIACLREGRTVSLNVTYQLLESCLATLDRSAARAILKGLMNHYEQCEALMNQIVIQASAPVVRKIADMFCHLLDLCGQAFGGQAFTEQVTTLTEQLQILQSEPGESVTTKRASRTPSYNSRKVSNRKVHAKEVQKSQASGDFRALFKIAGLYKKWQTLEARMARIDAHAKNLALTIRTGHDLDHEAWLPPIDWHKEDKAYPAVFHALQSVVVSRDMTLHDVRAQLLHGMPDQNLAEKFLRFAQWENLSIDSLIGFYHRGQNMFAAPQTTASSSSTADCEVPVADVAAEEVTKAMLFCQLPKARQDTLRQAYRNWYEMPLGDLYDPEMKGENEASAVEDCVLAATTPAAPSGVYENSPPPGYVDTSTTGAKSARSVLSDPRPEVLLEEPVATPPRQAAFAS
ncbi:uncharacterized protein JN550_009628 [Neoarthrinium moseri]|uniref:uncharacterized protein n=1 Tax=Neoarthrinium moseri TaxID=1658444 RepID=UPI001FDDAEDA|nr:uncharacterized protein JN550_009628 [Neoarthrinium moseri]KAI1863308.1 hypothetical protein JN550_009628 [Neoarthrinium moseri]